MNNNSISTAISQVEIYTDGGCEPNPDPGGYGVVLLHPKKRAEASGGLRLFYPASTTRAPHRGSATGMPGL